MSTFNIDLVNISNNITALGVRGTVTHVSGQEPRGEYYSLLLEYSPVGNPKDRTIHLYENVHLDLPYIFDHTAYGLKPNTTYTVTASLYRHNYVGGTPIARTSMLCTTSPLTATFECTSKSASVISVMFSDLPRLEFPIQVVLEYTKGREVSEATIWTELETLNLEAGDQASASRMVTGLNADTYYKFRVRVIDKTPRDTKQIATFWLEVKTIVYVPGADNVVPSFKRYIVVPKIDYVYLQAELNESLADGIELHLYRSQDDTTYTDIGTITNDDLSIVVDANWAISGGVRRSYFKLVIVDANNIEHNMSEPLLIINNGLWWLTREAGDPLDLTANEVLGMAETILKLYDLDVALGKPDIGSYKSTYQNLLKRDLQAVSRGAKVQGGAYTILNDMYALAQVFNNGSAGQYPYVLSGDILTADSVNTMFQEVVDAVNNYNVFG